MHYRGTHPIMYTCPKTVPVRHISASCSNSLLETILNFQELENLELFFSLLLSSFLFSPFHQPYCYSTYCCRFCFTLPCLFCLLIMQAACHWYPLVQFHSVCSSLKVGPLDASSYHHVRGRKVCPYYSR